MRLTVPAGCPIAALTNSIRVPFSPITYVIVAFPSGSTCRVMASPIMAIMGLVGDAGVVLFWTSVRIVYFRSALAELETSDAKHHATNTFFISPPGGPPVYYRGGWVTGRDLRT